MITVFRRRLRDQRGAAAVEFALVLPILLLLVFGIIEFGFIFNRWITVTHAAREGVRVLSLTGDIEDDPAALDTAIFAAQEAALATAPDILTEITCTGGLEPNPGGSEATQATMECTTTYDMAIFVITDEISFGSTAKMRLET